MTSPRPIDHAASAALWAMGLGWMGLTLPPLTLLYRAFGSHNVDGLTRVFTRGQVALTLCRWQAEVDEAVRPDRPYVFVQNHVNLFDHCTMYAATPHFKQGVELLKHFDIPLYGPFMKHRGTIPVDRDDKANLLMVQRRIKAELAAGRSLLAFPEGTRTRDGRVAPFQSGLFHIARSVGAEIVPVAVTGMFEVLGTPSRVMRPFQDVRVHVMAPIPTAGLARGDVDALTAQVHGQIAAKVDAYYARRGAL